MDSLLAWNSVGRNFEVWRLSSTVRSSLGFPTQRTFSDVPGMANTHELSYQRGAMQIRTAPNLCFRVFSMNDLNMRSAASCRPLANCKRKRGPIPMDDRKPDPDDGGSPDPDPVSSPLLFCPPAHPHLNELQCLWL